MFFQKKTYTFLKSFKIREKLSKLFLFLNFFQILNLENVEPKTIKKLILVRYMIDIEVSISHELPFYVSNFILGVLFDYLAKFFTT